MSEVKFTPGPWSIDADVIRGDDKPNGCVSVACVLDVAYPYGRRAGEQAQANAHLIAAAPELYEALNALRAELFLYAEGNYFRPLLDRAEVALAKARGEG